MTRPALLTLLLTAACTGATDDPPAGCERLTGAAITALFADVEDRAQVVDGAGGEAVNHWYADGRFVSRWRTAEREGALTGTWWVNDAGERCVSLSESPDGKAAVRCGVLYLCGDAVRSTNEAGGTHGVHRLRPLP